MNRPTQYRSIIPLLMMVLVLVAGCGKAYRGEVGSLTAQEDWEGALPHLKVAVAEDSTDAWAWRELGRARIKLGHPDEALSALRRAVRLDPKDASAHIYTGIAQEKSDDWQGALASYERSLTTNNLSFAQMREVRTRIVRATREAQKRRAVELVAQPGLVEENALAVYSFSASDMASPYQALRKGVAVMLITDLSVMEELKLVERLQLEAVLEELQRSKGGALDHATQVRAGKLIGAENSITGALVTMPGDELQLQYFVLNNRTGEFRGQGESRGRMEEVMRLEKEIAYGVLEQLGVEPTDEERRAIGRIPTTSFPAFLAFSEGVDLEDRQKYMEARSRYEQAVRLDPKFEEAKDRLDALGGMTSNGDIALSTEQFFENVESKSGRSTIAGGAQNERIAATSRVGGFSDDDDLDGGAAPQGNVYPPVGSGTGSISITVPVRN